MVAKHQRMCKAIVYVLTLTTVWVLLLSYKFEYYDRHTLCNPQVGIVNVCGRPCNTMVTELMMYI